MLFQFFTACGLTDRKHLPKFLFSLSLNTDGLANSLWSAFINDFLNSHSDKINNLLILANYTFCASLARWYVFGRDITFCP